MRHAGRERRGWRPPARPPQCLQDVPLSCPPAARFPFGKNPRPADQGRLLMADRGRESPCPAVHAVSPGGGHPARHAESFQEIRNPADSGRSPASPSWRGASHPGFQDGRAAEAMASAKNGRLALPRPPERRTLRISRRRRGEPPALSRLMPWFTAATRRRARQVPRQEAGPDKLPPCPAGAVGDARNDAPSLQEFPVPCRISSSLAGSAPFLAKIPHDGVKTGPRGGRSHRYPADGEWGGQGLSASDGKERPLRPADGQ